jgi:DNA-binding transcriptional LysR family regulator
MDTLTRMRAFIAVVENEGFSAAARKIGRSKALLSKYVRELEDELGALLLNRTTRQFSLTELGHTYYIRAVEIVREIDTLQDMVRDSREGVRGRIKIAAPRSFADSSLDQALIDFAAANPEIGLDIQLDDRFVDLVEEGFDLAIRVTALEDSAMIARRLAPFRLKIVATPETIAKYGAPEKPEDLSRAPVSSIPMRDDATTGYSRTVTGASPALRSRDRSRSTVLFPPAPPRFRISVSRCVRILS